MGKLIGLMRIQRICDELEDRNIAIWKRDAVKAEYLINAVRYARLQRELRGDER